MGNYATRQGQLLPTPALFELLAIVPHRVRLWAILSRRHFTERTHASGARCFHLHIGKEEFKNHRFLDIDYDLDLPARLTTLIQTYFEHAWPILNAPIGTFQQWRDSNKGKIFRTKEDGAVIPIDEDPRYAELKPMTPADRVFGMSFGSSVKPAKRKQPLAQEKTQLIIASLQRMTQRETCRFLGQRFKTNGFFPHAFRHIIATAEIKTTGSYERAALLLWDSVETVMAAYSHVKKTDLLARVVDSNELIYSPSTAVKPAA